MTIESATPDLRSRVHGSLFGLATGDALGTTLEFQSPGTCQPITDMRGGGSFGLKPGQWTDDTSLTLCMAESLIERGAFDARDQMKRYVRWWREGYLSSTGYCFDIGGTTLAALLNFEQTNDPFSGPTGSFTAGNGSLMRLAPVVLAHAHNPELAISLAGESSRTTHGARECIDACRYYAGLILGALRGESKDQLLGERYSPVPGLWERKPLTGRIDAIASGSFKVNEPPEIRGTGYVVKTLEAALWAFHRTDSCTEGLLKVVNLGEDADTTGAVLGQFAGAFYGIEAIPKDWIEKLAMTERISEFAESLYRLALG